MDEQVIAAMARWPDVPAVHGWLSLAESGQWRLHPAGDALRRPGTPGEAITSPQILAFIDRNYGADERGQWYFQNGPQRVYVRLDAAPFTAHTARDAATGRLKLRTHTGLDIREISALYLDETGRLYAATDRGPALVAGRDLPPLLDALETARAVPGTGEGADADTAGGAESDTDGDTGSGGGDIEEALVRCLETGETVMLRSSRVMGFPHRAIALRHCPREELEGVLRFRRRSVPEPAALPGSPSSPGSGEA